MVLNATTAEVVIDFNTITPSSRSFALSEDEYLSAEETVAKDRAQRNLAW